MDSLENWSNGLVMSLNNDEFVKLTLSKPVGQDDLLNIYVKLVSIKRSPHLSFTYHYKTKDTVKNFAIVEGLLHIRNLLETDFRIATLFTTKEDLVLRISKKGKVDVISNAPSQSSRPSRDHDKKKIKRASKDDSYLIHLGIADSKGDIIPKMADKYKQINKYLEVMESLIKTAELPAFISIVDMGAGKGYLTFALYDFLRNKLDKNVKVVGVELRQELVDQCNAIAKECGFEHLHFECSSIEDFQMNQADVLIALHACDTATDDAIAKGIKSNAALIVCAPCCHKQIRQQLKGVEHKSPLLKYGIFKEREFEMVTDTIRALILEKNDYKSNIFEFISNEHTRKNTMLVGVRSPSKADQTLIDDKIKVLKEEYQIDHHYLEKLM